MKSEARTSFFADFAGLCLDAGLPEVTATDRTFAAKALEFPRNFGLSQLRRWQPPNVSNGVWLRVEFDTGRALVRMSGIVFLLPISAIAAAVRSQRILTTTTRPKSTCDLYRKRLDPPEIPLDLDKSISRQRTRACELVDRTVDMYNWWERRGRETVDSLLPVPR